MSKKNKSAAQPGRPAATAPKAGPDLSSELPSFDRRFGPSGAVLTLALAALAWTLPLVLSLGDHVLGVYKDYYGDIFSGIWEFWSAKAQLVDAHASPFRFDMLAGPYSAVWISWLAAHKYPALLAPVTALVGPVRMLNLFVIGNLVLTGFCMYLLVGRLTGSRLAGVISGAFLAFCPYSYARSIIHLDLATLGPLALLLYCVLLFDKRPGLKTGLWVVLSLVLFHVLCSVYYYIYIPLVFGSYLLVSFVNTFVYDIRAGRRIAGGLSRISRGQWLAAGAVAVVLIAAGVYVYVAYLGPLSRVEVRPLLWQERFKLSWANYLFPGVDHPLFGELARNIVTIRRNVTESTAYLGWAPLLLALWGLRRWWRRPETWWILLPGLAGLVLSLGPYLDLGGLKLPLPSILLHKFAPFIRCIGRYSVFLQVSLAALAGMGLSELIRRKGREKLFPLLLGGILLVATVEYLHPAGTTRVADSPAAGGPLYTALAALPDSAEVIEYPTCASTGLAFTDYLYFQTLHHRDLFNRHFETNTIPTDYLPFWQDIDYPGSLSDPNNVALLRYFGVEWLAFHKRDEVNPPSLPLPDMQGVEGLTLEKDFGAERLYRVTAAPATVMLSFQTIPYYNYLEVQRSQPDEGFMAPNVLGAEGSRAGWRIMTAAAGLTVRSLSDSPQKVALRARAVSFQQERTLRVKDGDNLLSTVTVGVQPGPVTLAELELAPRQVLELKLDTPDGVNQINTADGTMSVSLALSAVRVDILQ
ncbi:hypothetical protein LLH00_03290 [bacterium]|nr:hypothetical protein [bacterium]